MKFHSRAMRLVRLLGTFTFGLCWFATSVPGATAATITYQPGPYQGKDAWITSYYDYGSDYGVNDTLLRVGGWGDTYWSGLWFDLTGLPANPSRVDLKLYCLPKGSGDTSTPVSMNMYRVGNSTWNEEDIGWTNASYYQNPAISLPTPTRGAWYTINITTWYNNWKSGAWPNNGLWLAPTANSNRFNNFVSSDYANEIYRPKLVITFNQPYQPPSYPQNIRMPLPSGKSWLLTTEVGGKDYRASQIDPANPDSRYVTPSHLGVNYFALDFSPKITGGTIQSSVSILAVADGYVVEVGSYNPNIDTPTTKPNGNYVVINHSYAPGNGTLFNRNRGLNSFYLHMKDPPTLTKGTRVYQGTKLGIMGNTGKSTGTHLHFQLTFDGTGLGREELAGIKMEGLPLKQHETSNGSAGTYYPSTNIMR